MIRSKLSQSSLRVVQHLTLMVDKSHVEGMVLYELMPPRLIKRHQDWHWTVLAIVNLSAERFRSAAVPAVVTTDGTS